MSISDVGAIYAMIVSRRTPHRCGQGDEQRGIALAIRAPAARDLGRWGSRKRHFAAIVKSFFTALTPSTFSATRVASAETIPERAVP